MADNKITIEEVTGARSDEWHLVKVTGRKVSGFVELAVTTYDRGEPALILDLDPSVSDNGRTVYEDGRAKRHGAVTINGVPYEGHAYYVERTRPSYPGAASHYLTAQHANKVGGRYADGLTDAAHKVLSEVAQVLAAQFFTPEAKHAHAVKSAESTLHYAEQDRDKAQAKVDEARAALEELRAQA